jgi:hypothetical protein
MDIEAKRVAQILAEYASKNSKTTYPILADRIGWYNKTGQGLGEPLTKVLEFCTSRGLPMLTTIVCTTGTDSPSERGLNAIRLVVGSFDLRAEQKKAQRFDWSTIEEFDLPKKRQAEIDYKRLFGTRGYGFDPDRWGMLGFGKEGSRDSVLHSMNGQPIYVVQFCSPNQQVSETGALAMLPENLGRILGVVRVLPNPVTSETHIEPEFLALSISRWKKDKWPFGLEVDRAWIFATKPFSRDVLPITSKVGWEATNSVVKLQPAEIEALTQHQLEEASVYGRPQKIVKRFEQEPAIHTYLAICNNTAPLAHTSAPPGTYLVKIGITNDRERRLLELSGNHIAVIFDMRFEPRAFGEWSDQREAERVEAQAHEWAHQNTRHASGEYFFMTSQQIDKAQKLIMLGRL